MPVEIERKFLVLLDLFDKQQATGSQRIVQCYWSQDNLPLSFDWMLEQSIAIPNEERQTIENMGPQKLEMRVRQKNNAYYVTWKSGALDNGGVMEFEYPISSDIAQQAFQSASFVIAKTRYLVPHGDYTLEVDVFDHGLVMAEIELPNMNEPIDDLPSWIGTEVTGQIEYTNRYICEALASRKQNQSPK